ncbi:MAG: hypothetical protein AB7L90_05445 [Hyphomicrobiaceae bacterium]
MREQLQLSLPVEAGAWLQPGSANSKREGRTTMKSIVLWLVGVPVSLIILLNVFGFLG